MREKFKVEGMTCAACQSHVDKAVRNLDCVSDVSVNLLTNSMEVEFNDKSDIDKINTAVKNAGYKSSLMNSSKDDINEEREALDNHEVKKLAKRLILSFIFLIPLFYLSMGFMMHWPIGNLCDKPILLGLHLLLLSLIIMIINKDFFKSGLRSLFHLSPNMDTLVALGSGVSFVYSVVLLFLMAGAKDNNELVMNYAMNFTFETAGMVPSLITIGKLLEAYSKGKTTNALKALMDLSPKEAHVIRDDKEIVIQAKNMVINDVFIVRPGEAIPTDGIVIEGASFVNESALTGESMPVEKNINDEIFTGTINQNGTLKCVATKVGEDTTLSKIIKMVYDANQTKAKISKIADKVAGIFVPIVMTIAIIGFVVWMIVGNNINLDINQSVLTFSINRAISVLVISCPCALGLATPVAIMVGSGVGAKNGILFKNAIAIEETGKTNFVILDKTGTITLGKPEVVYVSSYIENDEFINLTTSIEEKSSHPLAKSVYEYGKNHNYKNVSIDDFETLPGKGVVGTYNNKKLYGINLKYAREIVDIPNEYLNEINDISNKGITPLIYILDNKIIGILGLADTIKPDSAKAIADFKKLGIIPIMLTGDNKLTAKKIAEECNIDYYIAELLPDGKSEIIDKLKNIGHVLMVGDGINDALALTKADIGMAIGGGSDIAIDSADVVLMKSSLNDGVKAIRLSRQILKNIKENLFWAFFYNLIMIPIAIGIFYPTNIGWLRELKPWYGSLAMSLSSVFVVLNALRLNLFNPNKESNNKKMMEFDEKIITTNKEENNMENVVIKVDGMMCEHCKKHVEDACMSVNGVKKAEANLKKKNVTVSFDGDVNKDEIIKAINEAGYKA